ncbi:MAG: nucleotide exchange factor GrpE [Rikenellaceae bacterium]
MNTQETNTQGFNPEEETTQETNTQSNDATQSDNMSDTEGQCDAEADTLAEEATEAAAQPTEENTDWKDKYLRLQAEFDNYRKRTLKEKMDLVQSGGSDVLKAVLPVVDDMQRAQTAMAKSEDIEAIRGGVDLIANKFMEILKQRGVTPIEAIGCELDVDLHEAVARFAAGEDKKGKIIDVVQQGYMLGEKVLRFAKVVVGE